MSFSDLTKLELNNQTGVIFPITNAEEPKDEVLTLGQKVSNFFKGLKDRFVNARSSAFSFAGNLINRRSSVVVNLPVQLSETDANETEVESRPASRFSFKNLKDLFASAVSSASRFLCCFKKAPVVPVEIERPGVTYV